MGKSERPEHVAPPEVFYDEQEAHKYTCNSRIIAVQAALTERALELLALPDDQPRLLLDLGCGSGLSGEALTEAGHVWVVRMHTPLQALARADAEKGMDISEAMLDVGLDREAEGDMCLQDLGQGLPLRAGSFDGAISISAVQWLCNADSAGADPRRRMRRFFESLYASLTRGGRAVLQIYPESPAQAEMLTSAAMRAGFTGGLVVDYPHSTRAKKYFLVLMVGQSPASVPQPKGLDGEDPEEAGVSVIGRRSGHHGAKRRKHGAVAGSTMSARHPEQKGRAWIEKKKDNMRRKGYDNVPADSKYTGRKRKTRF